MFIAVDDTDSMKGNCTTFLATEIINEMNDWVLIGNPRLVRLNPAVPWKTRGNGSLVMEFGKNVFSSKYIGNISNKEIFVSDEKDETKYSIDELEKVKERIIPLIEKYHEDDANPGLIISNERPPSHYYKKGLTEFITIDEIVNELNKMDCVYYKIGNGRGLVGSFCGMSWIPEDYTYELLTYRCPEKWGTERFVVGSSIKEMDISFPTTFNSWEERENKVAMVPATPCPVLYGLRGDCEEDLFPASEMIQSEEIYRKIIFLTNQGTDDHIIFNAKELKPNASYFVKGIVSNYAKHIEHGHVFMDIDTKYGTITCGAYEPSKEFRMVFDRLIPGDEVEVMGEFREKPSTLNVEKIHVVSLTEEKRKISNPICSQCGKKMNSIGKNKGYRCKTCSTKSNDCVYETIRRQICTGWYEPPTAARRHLSKPLKRMNLEQPCELLNNFVRQSP